MKPSKEVVYVVPLSMITSLLLLPPSIVQVAAVPDISRHFIVTTFLTHKAAGAAFANNVSAVQVLVVVNGADPGYTILMSAAVALS